MTYLERFKKDLPDAPLENNGTPKVCPCDLGYEENEDCPNSEANCVKCWNRIIPGTKTILDALLEAFPNTPLLGEDSLPGMCPSQLGAIDICESFNCKECWSQVYKERE